MKHDCPHCGVSLKLRLLSPFGGWRHLLAANQSCPKCGGKVQQQVRPAEDEATYFKFPFIVLLAGTPWVIRWICGAGGFERMTVSIAVGVVAAGIALLLARKINRISAGIPADWQKFKAAGE